MYGVFAREWMQVVLIVLLRRGVYVPFIAPCLSALLDTATTGSFFVMLKTVGRALFSHLPRLFRLTDRFNLSWISKDRYSFCVSLCTTCRVISLSQIYVNMQYINQQCWAFCIKSSVYTRGSACMIACNLSHILLTGTASVRETHISFRHLAGHAILNTAKGTEEKN